MNSRNAENEGILNESQVQDLEQGKEEKEAHGEIETPHPGFLLGQDTCYIGYIKGVGKIYQQTAIDTHSNVGFDKVYPDKTALTAADFLNNKVLPFFNFREYGIDSHLNRSGNRVLWTHRNPHLSTFFASEWSNTFQNKSATSANQWINRKAKSDCSK